MSAQLIDGKKIAADMKYKIKEEVLQFVKETGKEIGLAVILVGSNPASQVYVRNKVTACEVCGIKSFAYYFDESVSEAELLELIGKLNCSDEVNGILVQLPLPKHLDSQKILTAINYKKDVDGFHAMNAGNLLLFRDCLPACTPSGCLELIKSTGIDIAGKNAVVLGRSNIVGKPMSMLLLAESATVTVCHSRTIDLASYSRNADILVVAIGQPKFIKGDYIKPGAVVIDVGMDRDENEKLCGDVDFESAKDVASFITPVPGGVGPMTICFLMKNTLKAARMQNEER